MQLHKIRLEEAAFFRSIILASGKEFFTINIFFQVRSLL